MKDVHLFKKSAQTIHTQSNFPVSNLLVTIINADDGIKEARFDVIGPLLDFSKVDK